MLFHLDRLVSLRPTQAGRGVQRWAGGHGQLLTIQLALGVCLATGAEAQIEPNSPTPQWVPILYAGGSFADGAGDQRTGSTELDLVGDATQASLYMRYDSGGSPVSTNGWLGFRLRVAADVNPSGWKGVAFIGLDADLNGALDLFIGVNNSGTPNQIAICSPGMGLNISPTTTSVTSPPLLSYAEATTSYGLAEVTPTTDPFATNFDLDGGGRPDQFLSFVVPFSDVVAALATRGISGFDKYTPLCLMAVTSNQGNSLNGDLNGVAGSLNSSLTWRQLGAYSQIYSFNSITPIPEPKPIWLASIAGGFWLLFLSGRRRVV